MEWLQTQGTSRQPSMTCNTSNEFTPVTVWKPHHINDFLDHVWFKDGGSVCGKKRWVRDGLRKLFVFKRSKVSNSPWKPREDQDVGKVWELYLSGVSEKVKLTEYRIYLVESVRVIHWGLTGNEMLHFQPFALLLQYSSFFLYQIQVGKQFWASDYLPWVRKPW